MTDGGKKAPGSSGHQGKRRKPPVGRRFKPGQSGNPLGLSAERRAILVSLSAREKPHLEAVVVLLREQALKGIEWAMTDYMDRFGIRVPDKLEVSGEDGAPLPPVEANPLDPGSMRSEEVRKRLAAIRAEREQLLAGLANNGEDDSSGS